MRKKLIAVLGTFGTVMALAAAGCSSSSSDVGVVGGGDSGTGSSKEDSGGGSFDKDGGTSTGKDASVAPKDGGTVIVEDSGASLEDSGTLPDSGIVVVDSGTVISHTDAGSGTTLDAGSGVDAGGTLPDGGPLACFSSTDARYDNSAGVMLHQNKCTSTQITTFDTDCFGSGATTSACNALLSADPDCATCIFGGAAATAPSAVVLPIGSQDEVNSIGCVAALSSGTAQCKFDYENVSYCAQTACASCSTSAYDGCTNFAETDSSSVCASNFGIDSTCAAAVDAVGVGPAQTECGIGVSSFDTAFMAVATTFCGP